MQLSSQLSMSIYAAVLHVISKIKRDKEERKKEEKSGATGKRENNILYIERMNSFARKEENRWKKQYKKES